MRYLKKNLFFLTALTCLGSCISRMDRLYYDFPIITRNDTTGYSIKLQELPEYTLYGMPLDKNKMGHYYRVYKDSTYTFYDPEMRLLKEGKIFPDQGRGKNRESGKCVYYYAKSGKKAQEGYFDNGERVGEWISYYPNGVMERKEHYQLTNRDTLLGDSLQIWYIDHSAHTGTYELYFRDGSLKIKGEYEIVPGYAFCYAVRTDDTTHAEIRTYASGLIALPEGHWIEYTKKGKIKREVVNLMGGMHYDYEESNIWPKK